MNKNIYQNIYKNMPALFPGYFAPGVPPVEFTSDNEFCRFKAVGYIKMPTFSPEEGLVELVISKKDTIVR